MTTDHDPFTRCSRDDPPRVLACVHRHAGDHDAHDVDAETFLAA